MGLATPPMDFVIRLADEGVPLRAIARAVEVPSEDLRVQLHEACNDGRLVELPRDDWPPGFPRDERALQLSRLTSTNRHGVQHAVAALFKLTASETKLLLALVQADMVYHERYDLNGKVMPVHIHAIRQKLKPFGISISTMWGYGYQLLAKDRQRAADIILRHVTTLPTL